MSYRILEDTRQELDLALEYYESVQPGLSLEFIDDFESTIRNVVTFPEA